MILAALFTRPVVRRPLRFLATVLGVAAGVASIVSTLASSRAAMASLTDGVTELAGSAVLEVTRPGGVDESELGRLAPLADDAWIAPVVEELALSPALGDSVRFFGIDPFVDARVREFGPKSDQPFEAPTSDGAPTANAFLELVEGRGAFVSAELARDLDVRVGGTFELDVSGRPLTLKVLATFPSPAGTAALDRLVVVDVALAQRATGGGKLDRIELAPRRGVALEDLRTRARSLTSTGCRVDEPRERAASNAGLVRSLEFNLTSVSGISLLVGSVLVATTLATSVVQRRRTIALLYALGASRGQVVRAILFEGLCLGLLGGAVGVVWGVWSARFMAEGMRATASTIVSGTEPAAIPFTWPHAALGVALGVVAALVSSVLPLLEGARTPPIQSLRGEAPEFQSSHGRRIALGVTAACLGAGLLFVRLPAWGGLPIPSLLGSLAILAALFATFGPAVDAIGRLSNVRWRLPVPLRLAGAGLSAGRRRAAWAAGAVGLAVALSMSIATMVISFRETLVDWTDQSLHTDLAVRPPHSKAGLPVGRLDPSIVPVVAATLPEALVDPYYTAPAFHQGQRVALAAVRFAVSERRGGTAMLDGSNGRDAIARARASGGVLVSEAGAHRFGWTEGQTITIEVAGREISRRISGIYCDYGDSQGLVMVDEAEFLTYFPTESPHFVDVYLPAGADPEPARQRLLARFGSDYRVEILNNRELRSSVLAVFDQTFAITRALQAASALVAVIAVLTVLFALVAERRADLAMLASLGASGGQVRLLVCFQSGLLGLLGAGGGVIAGLGIGYVLVRVVNLQSFGWTLNFVPPWGALATTTVFVAFACLVAGLIPARAAAAGRLREALREE